MKTLISIVIRPLESKLTDTVLVTIVEGNGSIPRTTGAYMAADQTRQNLWNNRRRKSGISGRKKSNDACWKGCSFCRGF